MLLKSIYLVQRNIYYQRVTGACMTARLRLLTIFCISAIFASAQTCIPVFKNEYGGSGNDEGLAVFYTKDKGSIIAGRTTSASAGSYDGFLMKLSETGTIEWSRNYGGVNYDEFTKVKQTVDGGYIVLGFTNSFGNLQGESIVLKTDASGTIQWTNKFIQSNTTKNRASDIVQLQDGTFALLINVNDSTINSDALILKLTGAGTVIWSKIYDNGNNDGFNAIMEENDSLVVGGRSFNTDIGYGVIMKINKNTGAFYKATLVKKWYPDYTTYHYDNEIIMVEKITGGITFSSVMTLTNPPLYDNRSAVTNFKMMNNGEVVFESIDGVGTATGRKLEKIISRPTSDGGYINLISDTTVYGFPRFTKMGATANIETGRGLYAENYNEYTKMFGTDTTDYNGFVFCGYSANPAPGSLNKVRVIKTDFVGLNGSCSFPYAFDFVDTAHHSFTNFIWNNNSDYLQALHSPIPLVSINNNFAPVGVCQETYCTPPPVFPDTCNATFLVTVRGNAVTDIFDTEKINDGGYMAVGGYFFATSFEPFIARIKSNGEVAWSKSYAHYFRSGYFKKIIPTNDGNFLLVGIDNYVIDHYAYTKSSLVKIDSDGNLLWVKEYSQGGDFDIYNIIPAPNGDFIACANFGWGYGYLYNYIMRLDKDGNFIWKKQVEVTAGSPVYKQLFLEGNDLFIGADYYQGDNLFRIERWNALNGQMIWNQRYQINSANQVRITGITKIADTVYAALNVLRSVAWNDQRNHASIVKFLPDGTMKGGYEIINPNHTYSPFNTAMSEHSPFDFQKTEDNNFITAQQSVINNDTTLAITKFTPGGEMIWSKSYDKPKDFSVWSIKNDGDNTVISGKANPVLFDEIRKDKSFILKVDKNGDIRDNAQGECVNKPAGYATEIIADINLVWNDVAGAGDENYVAIGPYSGYFRENSVQSYLSCSLPATCNSLQVNGPDTICDLSASYRYEIVKNQGCLSPALWVIDTSVTRILAQTDTTIDLQFKKSGLVAVNARLNAGCQIYKSEKQVTVVNNSLVLSLGADTSLCPGNTIILNAQAGFDSYLWQDGTTQSSYQVSTAGKYYVTVKNICGQFSSDTIIVSLAASVPLSVGADRVKCNNDTVRLNAPNGFLNYTWSPAYNINSIHSQNIIINPQTDTTYFLVAEKTPGCFGFDTVHIIVNKSAEINLGRDTSFCTGEELLLNAGMNFSNYEWNTGSEDPSITVTATGTYSVTATDINGCRSSDTLIVNQIYRNPIVTLDKNTVLCENETRLLDAGNFEEYLWGDGTSDKTLLISAPGKYIVMVTDKNGCKTSDSTIIKAIAPIPSGFLPPAIAVCQYGSVTLASSGNFKSYSWSTNDFSPTIETAVPGIYWLQVTDDNNCTGRDSITVVAQECMTGFFIPSAFTPNQDGLNDSFKAILLGNVEKFHFTIYNKWGELVFQTKTPGQAWNGKYKGKDLKTDVFVWTCSYQLQGEGTVTKKGTVTLIR